MDNVTFLNQDTRKPFAWDADSGAFVRPQFSSRWYVQIDLPPQHTLAVYHEGKLVTLIRDDGLQGYRPKADSKKSIEIARDINAVVGLVEVIRCSDQPGIANETLSPGLWTVPANLSADDYREMLDYLKGIAIKYCETAKALVKDIARRQGDFPEIAPHHADIEGVTGLADMIVSIGSCLQQFWPMLTVAPSVELTSEMKTARLDQPVGHRSSHLFRRAVMRPDRPVVTMPTAKASFDTQENRFLAHFLDVLIRVSRVILVDLKAQIKKLEHLLHQPATLPNDVPARLRRQYQLRLDAQRQRLTNEVKQLTSLRDRVADVLAQAHKYIKAGFLKASMRHKQPPDRPSQKLLQGTTYAPLFQSYRDFAHVIDIKRFLQVSDVLDRWHEVSVRPIDDLYEEWLFLKLYEILVGEFHFQPVGSTPKDSLRITPTGLELPKNMPFVLEMYDLSCPGGPCLCQIELTYQPVLKPKLCQKGKLCFDPKVCPTLPCFQKIMVKKDWQDKLTPDISVVAKVNDKVFRFIIDAKYRSYDVQCVESKEMELYRTDDTFATDVLGIAKTKYLNGLACDEHDVQATFIVHTDQGQKWTFWGGERFRQRAPLREEALEALGHPAYWPGHTFGAVFATPLLPDNLSVLLKCFLMYHAELYNICWNCGKRLTVDNGGATPSGVEVADKQVLRKIVEGIENRLYIRGAVYYHCPDCNEFWVLQRCYGPEHHPILKFGDQSFHAGSRTHPDNKWLNICPQCGSDLPAENKSRLPFEKDTSRKRD